MSDYLNYFLPYHFSWPTLVVFTSAAIFFWQGFRRSPQAIAVWRIVVFYLGLAVAYGALQTQFDYYAHQLFFVHRLQHLALHYLASVLIVASSPWSLLFNGIPSRGIRAALQKLHQHPVFQWINRFIQQPLVAWFLFVSLVGFWLIPGVYHLASENQALFQLMNWSFLLNGMLFWWLVLDPRDPQQSGTTGFGRRILLIWAVTVPQLIMGAFVMTQNSGLYRRPEPEYLNFAGWIDGQTDQALGGIFTWIPPALIGVLVMVVVLRRLLKFSEIR